MMNVNPFIGKGKREKQMYYLEVAENCRHQAQELEKRIEKALELGADDPSHEHHKFYLELMGKYDSYWKHHTEFLAAYTQEAEGDELYEKAKEIFKVNKI